MVTFLELYWEGGEREREGKGEREGERERKGKGERGREDDRRKEGAERKERDAQRVHPLFRLGRRGRLMTQAGDIIKDRILEGGGGSRYKVKVELT